MGKLLSGGHQPSYVSAVEVGTLGTGPKFGGGFAPTLRSWLSPSALSSAPSLVVEAMSVLEFMGRICLAQSIYSLLGKPKILVSGDGGALSVIPSM
jgi:hypothetical protein